MERVRPLSANHKRVYRALPSASGPMTAYQLLDALRPNGISAAPTVYRARLETMSADVAWADPRHGHDAAMFVICHGCGRSTRHMEAVS
jgi:Fur family transcriptional regulator, zinc uptake regulator